MPTRAEDMQAATNGELERLRKENAELREALDDMMENCDYRPPHIGKMYSCAECKARKFCEEFHAGKGDNNVGKSG